MSDIVNYLWVLSMVWLSHNISCSNLLLNVVTCDEKKHDMKKWMDYEMEMLLMNGWLGSAGCVALLGEVYLWEILWAFTGFFKNT
jgi:hypothetical protein